MSRWSWQGRESGGGWCEGELDAPDAALLQQQLLLLGIRVHRVRRLRGWPRRYPRQLCWLVRQLASLLQAGIPLVPALQGLAREPAHLALRPMLGMLCRQLEAGQALSCALAWHPRCFDSGFCLALAAAEQGGMLDQVLGRLALEAEKRLRLYARVRGALTYPLTILLMTLLLLVLMLLTVIPAFKLAFASQGQGLPGPTLLVIALSDGVCAYGLYMLAGAGVGLLGLRRGWQRFPGWRAALDRWCLRFPLSGSLSRQLVLVRWCRTLSMLIAAGVPLLDALLSAGQAAGNRVYLEASVKVQRRIRLGSSLTASLRADRCFPPLLLQLATVGEASGALDQVFERAAQYYEQQAEDALQLLTSVLEPLAMAVLGVLCAALIWALYLPIFQLGQVLG